MSAKKRIIDYVDEKCTYTVAIFYADSSVYCYQDFCSTFPTSSSNIMNIVFSSAEQAEAGMVKHLPSSA